MKIKRMFNTLRYGLPSWFRCNVLAKLDNLWYWVRAHTYNRYHIVDTSRQAQYTGYEWGWQDVDQLMLYSLFELFMRHVERERGLENLQFQALADPSPMREHVLREAQELYHWWTELRPQRVQRPVASYEDVQDMEFEDTQMMIRLIKIRGSLWT